MQLGAACLLSYIIMKIAAFWVFAIQLPVTVFFIVLYCTAKPNKLASTG